jgi:hypothetical protein
VVLEHLILWVCLEINQIWCWDQHTLVGRFKAAYKRAQCQKCSKVHCLTHFNKNKELVIW